MSYIHIYKCRLCGKTIEESGFSEMDINYANFMISHKCDEVREGIADFQGRELINDEQEK